MINKSYIWMKFIALASLVFYTQRFFILSLVYILEPSVTHLPKTTFDFGLHFYLIFDFLYALFLFLGFLGSVLTYGLKENGRKILVVSLINILILHCIALLPNLRVPTYTDIGFPVSVVVFVFLINAIFILTHPKVKEHFETRIF